LPQLSWIGSSFYQLQHQGRKLSVKGKKEETLDKEEEAMICIRWGFLTGRNWGKFNRQ
jgi:hypothetical protein